MGDVLAMSVPEPYRPRDYNNQQLALVKRTVAKDCSNDEFDLFIEVCKRVGLDPFRRQIHCVIYNKDNAEKRQMTLITGIDGYRAVAARNGNYRPDSAVPVITYDETLKDATINPLGIEKATVTVYKQDNTGAWEPIAGEAYWDEFAPIVEEFDWVESGEVWQDSGKPKKKRVGTGAFKLQSDFWKKMGRNQIAKCAEAQALRKGWPEDLSGVYVEEEMHRATAEETASEMAEKAEQERRLALVSPTQIYPIIWKYGAGMEGVEAGKMADQCMAFIEASTDRAELEHWRDSNKIGLQQFWAMQKTDALAVKSALENKIKAISSPIDTNPDPRI